MVEKKATPEKEEQYLVDSEVAEKVVTEAKVGYREWELDDKKYRTRYPDTRELNEANWAYSTAFNRALTMGLPTQSQMDRMLREKGVWTEEDDNEIEDYTKTIKKVEALLAKKNPKDSSKSTRALVAELAEARANFIVKNGTYSEFMSQTVEAKADESKQAFLISTCTEEITGDETKLVWKTVDEFLTDRNFGLVNQATYQYVTFSSGLASNYIEELTEVKFLRAGKQDELEA